MKHKTTEEGQALVLIALAAVVLFGFAALAIDGSRLYSEKRHAQNAADTAALAAALAYTRDNTLNNAGITNVAQARATSNGYDNNGTSNKVTVTAVAVPTGQCPGNVAGKDITVDIVARLNTTFARVLGRDQVTTAVTATARGCGFYWKPLFDGNAIVGLNDNLSAPCGINSWNGDWYITGSGLFSNGCAEAHKIVDLDDGKCMTTIGTASGFPAGVCLSTATEKVVYPDDVNKIMPPNPCDGTAGDIGITQPAGVSTFANGVYCISNLDILDDRDITLTNATLYITDPAFNVKFAGGGGFYGTATKKGTYTGSEDFDDYYMIVPIKNPPCENFTSGTQVIVWRGNGSGSVTGTILAPSSCLDLRGNGTQYAMDSQIIGYTVTSNGSSELHVNYNVANNRENPVYPTISVLK